MKLKMNNRLRREGDLSVDTAPPLQLHPLILLNLSISIDILTYQTTSNRGRCQLLNLCKMLLYYFWLIKDFFTRVHTLAYAHSAYFQFSCYVWLSIFWRGFHWLHCFLFCFWIRACGLQRHINRYRGGMGNADSSPIGQSTQGRVVLLNSFQ